MWSTCGCLAIIVGAMLCAVGVIAATITNDTRDYFHSEYGGRVFAVGLALMAVGGLVIVGRLLRPRPR
jgi:uncharacterized membrane protein